MRSAKTETRTCSECPRTFVVGVMSKRATCSPQCQDVRAAKRKREHAGVTMEMRECPECGKWFEVSTSSIQVVCGDYDCQIERRKRVQLRRYKERRAEIPMEQRECPVCLDTFEAPVGSRRVTCANKEKGCAAEWKRRSRKAQVEEGQDDPAAQEEATAVENESLAATDSGVSEFFWLEADVDDLPPGVPGWNAVALNPFL